jgi:phage/plasmid-associated DNA primase
MYADKNFKNEIDENRDLFCFKNGVFDLATMEFREGRPSDYITQSAGVNYEVYDENNLMIKKVDKFFRDIIPDEQVREYLYLYLASCLHGSNPH